MIYADKPVLAVKLGARPLMRRIFCPVDFSEASKRALINAIHLSRTFEAHLTVLTVFEPLLSSFFGPGRTPGESKEKALVKRQQYQYDRFLRGFESENLKWTKTILRGKPHEEILKAIREAQPDLLVMGSQGRTGLSRLLMGSTTERGGSRNALFCDNTETRTCHPIPSGKGSCRHRDPFQEGERTPQETIDGGGCRSV